MTHCVVFPAGPRGNAVCDCGGWRDSWSSAIGRARAISSAAAHITGAGTSLQLRGVR